MRRSTQLATLTAPGVVRVAVDAAFSGVISASHTPDYAIFNVGTPPTPGLENLSEEGKHTPLDSEIRCGSAGVPQ